MGCCPGGEAGFGIGWRAGDTRVVIPYYGRGLPKSGKIDVTPLVSGALGVNWAVVGHDGCAPRVDTPGQGRAQITVETAGRPRIVVSNPVPAEAPERRFVSPDGTRHLEIYAGRYRLLDAATGGEILSLVGEAPRFSPSGRYLVLPRGDEAGIFDSVDGARISDQGGAETIWSHGDSFMLQLVNGYGIAVLSNPVTGRDIGGVGNGCRICAGHDSVAMLDLENNVYWGHSGVNLSLDRISGGAFLEIGTEAFSKRKIGPREIAQARDRAEQMQAVTALTVPQDHFYSSSQRVAVFRELSPQGNWSADAVTRNERLREMYQPQTELTAQSGQEVASPAASTRGALNWRSAGTSVRAVTPDRMRRRLAEFGIETLSQTPVPEARLGKSDSFFRKAWGWIALDTQVSAQSFALPEPRYSCGARPNRLRGLFDRAWYWDINGDKFWMTTGQCAEGSAAFNNPTTYLFSSRYPKGVAEYTAPWGPHFALDLDNPDNNTGPDCRSQLDNCGFEVTRFGELLVLHSQEALGYAVIDLGRGEIVQTRFGLPRGDLFENVLLAADGKHLVSVQSDGTFFVNRLADAQTVLSGLYADDEIVVWTEDGQFDATAEGAHFVSYTFPGHFGEYTAQQFEGYLKVPGLVGRVMSGRHQPREIAITPPPVLQAAIEVQGATVRLRGAARAQVGLSGVSVFQDGLRTDRLESAGPEDSFDAEIDLLAGTRWISLVAEDANRVASAPYTLEIDAPQQPRRVHLLSIGVNDYGDPGLDLSAAVGDAKLFAQAVGTRADSGVEIATNTVLLDAAATPEAILQALREIVDRSAPGETLAMYFAGHGLGIEDRYYLAGAGVDLDDIAGSSLSFDAVTEVLQGTDLRIVLFLDACHSGLAGEGLFSTNDDVVGGALDQIPSGLVVFAAAKGREYSLEDPRTGEGFFARALMDVLVTDRATHDANGNGAIELSELFRSTKSLVSARVQAAQADTPAEARLSQTPWMARNLMVGDFSLF